MNTTISRSICFSYDSIIPNPEMRATSNNCNTNGALRPDMAQCSSPSSLGLSRQAYRKMILEPSRCSQSRRRQSFVLCRNNCRAREYFPYPPSPSGPASYQSFLFPDTLKHPREKRTVARSCAKKRKHAGPRGLGTVEMASTDYGVLHPYAADE